MTWIADRQYNRWMSIFFGTFILLSELSKITEDAYHHGWYDKDIKGNVCCLSTTRACIQEPCLANLNTRVRRMLTLSGTSTRVPTSSSPIGTTTTVALTR